MKNTTEGAVSAESGARMLQKVGDFVEPLTRFDKSHLKLISCSDVTVPIVVTQTFEARFSTSTDSGNGALPNGIRDVTSDKRLETELEAKAREIWEEALTYRPYDKKIKENFRKLQQYYSGTSPHHFP